MLITTKITISIAILSILMTGLYTILPNNIQNKQLQNLTANTCLSYLPYNIWNNLQTQYPKWYGLQGKDIKGKTFLPGHALQRHIAVNNACTNQQKQQNKTVFLNMVQFEKAANQIPTLCDIPNRTTFTYDYDGKIASPTNFIQGIDCKTGSRQTFPAYFVQFKRAIKNASPSQQDYLNSNHTTIWTLYPKRLTAEDNKNLKQNTI